jgi:hypothetical protein
MQADHLNLGDPVWHRETTLTFCSSPEDNLDNQGVFLHRQPTQASCFLFGTSRSPGSSVICSAKGAHPDLRVFVWHRIISAQPACPTNPWAVWVSCPTNPRAVWVSCPTNPRAVWVSCPTNPRAVRFSCPTNLPAVWVSCRTNPRVVRVSIPTNPGAGCPGLLSKTPSLEEEPH